MLAYYDGLHGLVKCRVLKIARHPGGFMSEFAKGQQYAEIVFTADGPGHKRGDRWTAPTTRVFPRNRVINHRSIAGARVLPYRWEDTPNATSKA